MKVGDLVIAKTANRVGIIIRLEFSGTRCAVLINQKIFLFHRDRLEVLS
jgi:hypothetical protein